MHHSELPIDSTSAATLAESNLRMGLVDTSDKPSYDTWLQAANRGFHGAQLPDEKLEAFGNAMRSRRSTGVWDGEAPVGTVNAFPSPVTLPGGRELPAWAISMVTVAATHRRRGIARELLQSELRTAVALGIPMAMLTVSESTIYHRFGFAPAVLAADLTIDTRRAHMAVATSTGRLEYIPVEQLRTEVDALYATARLASPGEIAVWPERWDQIIGTRPEEKDVAKRPRATRYLDDAGVTQGFVVYTMKENEADFTDHTAEVLYLMANTPEAYAALWRYTLELDLTSTVKAHLRSADEPVRWLVDDFRSVKVETWDHLWLRILDVVECLQTRPYFAPASLVLEVTDALGHAAGTFSFEVVDGEARVSRAEAAPDLTLSINELSAIYLGGISAVTLLRAERIVEHVPGSVAALEAALRSPVTPWLSVWF